MQGGAPSSAPAEANTRSTEPQRAAEEIFSREARPTREAPRVIHLGPLADELGHAAEQAAGIVGGLADGVEKALGAALDFAADFIAPPPPPTKEQVRPCRRTPNFGSALPHGRASKPRGPSGRPKPAVRRTPPSGKRRTSEGGSANASGIEVTNGKCDSCAAARRSDGEGAAEKEASPGEPVARGVERISQPIDTGAGVGGTVPALARGDYPNLRQPFAHPVAL